MKLARKIDGIEIDEKGYKSLKNFTWKNIPDFAVITGLNGSGKTHLLEAIYYYPFIKDTKTNAIKLNYQNNEPVKAGFFKDAENPVSQYTGYAESSHNNGSEILPNLAKLLKDYLNPSSSDKSTSIKNLSAVLALSNEQIISKINEIKSLNSEKSLDYITIKCVLEFLDYAALNSIIYVGMQLEKNLEHALSKMILFFKKFPKDLKKIINNYDENGEMSASEGTQLRHEAEIFFLKKQDPCELINEVLADHRKSYRNSFDLKYDISYDPQKVIKMSEATIELVDIKNREKRQFSDLSSGEKVIISLLVKFFTIPKIKGVDVIIVDEFDAHLNPQMASMYLDIMLNSFCKKYDKQVILTTHNPSTVAYSPEESLFWMENGQIIPKNKSETLAELTPGLILLEDNAQLIGEVAMHINKNKYILFVEGKSDEIYFKKAIELFLPDKRDKIFVFGCGSVTKIAPFVEISKQIRNNKNCDNFIALIDNDDARKQENKIVEKGCKVLKIEFAEPHKNYIKLFLERGIKYPIEFLFEDQFFLNDELTNMGESLFKEDTDLLNKLKGEDVKKKIEFSNKIKNEAKFLTYCLKGDNDRSKSKITVAKEIANKASEADEETAKNIFHNFKPTIDLIKKEIEKIA